MQKNTLKKCIDSVLLQNTEFSYEIIIINDGSTDNTVDILNKYSNTPNLIIYSQNNQEISSARNKGLELSSGEYIMFVDSDDVLYSFAINNLLIEAFKHKACIVEGNYYINENMKDTRLGYAFRSERIELNIENNNPILKDIKGYPWGKVYCKSLWDNIILSRGNVLCR